MAHKADICHRDDALPNPTGPSAGMGTLTTLLQASAAALARAQQSIEDTAGAGLAAVMHAHARLEERLLHLQAKEEAWVALQARVQDHVAMAGHKVKLDIGGTIFATTKPFLLSFEHSFFSALLTSGHWLPHPDGTYKVDRPPLYFNTMLQFMRTGQMETDVWGWPAARMDGLREEFDFYQVAFPAGPAPPAMLACHGQLVRTWVSQGTMAGQFTDP